jgi:hypothetical protein
MSKANSAKTGAEYWQFLWRKYQQKFPGPFSPNAVVDWAVANGLADLPKIDPRKLLVRDLKRAAREIKITDPQQREVREMLPAKVPIVGADGQMFMEVVYDHIHSMSADHALLAFDQRDENIVKQKRSATRDLESFLDNNPNAKGHEHQFVFEFLEHTPEQKPVAKIEESPTKKSPKPR